MYNTILQTSLLLFGSDIKTIRFEANMLRSLGIKSIRGIVDIEGYLKKKTIYPMVDAFLVHEHCTPYTGIEFIEKLRIEYNCVSPIILILSSPPSVVLMQTLESLSSVALVRPYTRRDVQRALVQSKRVITEQSSIEGRYYKRVEQELEHNETHTTDMPIEQSNTFLVAMIQFQFFFSSGEYEQAAERLISMHTSMSKERLLSLIERTAQETKDKTRSIELLCEAVKKHNKELSYIVSSALVEGYEQKNAIKKLSERKARVISEGNVTSVWKNLQ